MQNLPAVSLFACVAAISAGQLLFKIAAINLQPEISIQRLVTNWALVLGLALYGAATIFWIWLLRTTPLTMAYPFMAMSFILVPIAASIFLGEAMSPRLIIGSVVISAGIILATGQ